MGQPEAMRLMTRPVWQKGTPQSIHLEPWLRSSSSSMCSWNSSQFLIRSKGLTSLRTFLLKSINPLGLPICFLLNPPPFKLCISAQGPAQLLRYYQNFLNINVRVQGSHENWQESLHRR